MQERHQLFFGLRPQSKPIFSSNKIVPANKKDSMQTVIRTSKRLDSFLHEAAQNFEIFSNIQE
jgi:hypothetical protein